VAASASSLVAKDTLDHTIAGVPQNRTGACAQAMCIFAAALRDSREGRDHEKCGAETMKTTEGTASRRGGAMKPWRAGMALAALLATAFVAQSAEAGCNVANKRSEKGTKTAMVEVVNKAKTQAVNLYWIDYKGKQVFYAKVPAGGRFKQQTYRSHPWIITNQKGRCLDGLVAGQGNNRLVYNGDKNDGWKKLDQSGASQEDGMDD